MAGAVVGARAAAERSSETAVGAALSWLAFARRSGEAETAEMEGSSGVEFEGGLDKASATTLLFPWI